MLPVVNKMDNKRINTDKSQGISNSTETFVDVISKQLIQNTEVVIQNINASIHQSRQSLEEKLSRLMQHQFSNVSLQ